MDDLSPSDEDKPYVTESEDTEPEENTKPVSKHKRKTIIKRLQNTKPLKEKPSKEKKSQKPQSQTDKNDTTPQQQPEPQQCRST